MFLSLFFLVFVCDWGFGAVGGAEEWGAEQARGCLHVHLPISKAGLGPFDAAGLHAQWALRPATFL